MDAEELKVVITELRDIHVREIERNNCQSFEQEQRRAENVCLKHGGHEFERRNVSGLAGDANQCKFCDAHKAKR